MKRLTLALLVFFGFTICHAQDQDTTYWKKDFRGGLSFNQASFSDNWTGGGVNSIGLNAFVNYKFNYRKDVHSWDNQLDLGYGILKNEGQSSRKSIDLIFYDTKYGRQINNKWSYFTSLTFLTQFAPGYNYDVEINGVRQDSLISTFLAPAFITSSWGLEFKPKEYFNMRFGLFSPRLTIVNDDKLANTPSENDPTKGAYGVDLGDNLRTEIFALQIAANFNKDIAENLNLKWRYMLYADYERFNVEQIDHRLDIALSAKVNSFVDVALGALIIYDYDQVDELQLSQNLNLAFVYKFKNFEDKK